MGKRGRPPGSKDSHQRCRSKKTTAAKFQFRSNVKSTTCKKDGASTTSECEDQVSDDLELPINQLEFRPEDVEATLDNDNDFDNIDAQNGIMGIFLKAVHRELREEVRGRVAKEPWLLTMLKAPGADWWIRAGQARLVCKKLGLLYGEPCWRKALVLPTRPAFVR